MKVGLSLSGGGVRAAAHIGVLKVLKKHGIPIDLIAGTSAASLVASLYAIGYSVQEIEELFLSYQSSPMRVKSLIDPDYLGIFKNHTAVNGFIKGDKYQNTVGSLVRARGHLILKDAQIPLAIPAVDLVTSKIIMFVSDKTMLFDDSDIIYLDNATYSHAIRASSSFPAVMRPMPYLDYQLIDGGVRENLPADVLREMGADIIIGVNAGHYGKPSSNVCGITHILSRVLDIMTHSLSENFAEFSDVLLLPEVHDVGTFEFEKIEHCIKYGETVTENSINLIKNIVK